MPKHNPLNIPSQGYIYETVIYNGATKEWRVLNVNTGTFYSNHFENFNKAKDSIEDGKGRNGAEVKYVPLREIKAVLDMHFGAVKDTGLMKIYFQAKLKELQ